MYKTYVNRQVCIKLSTLRGKNVDKSDKRVEIAVKAEDKRG